MDIRAAQAREAHQDSLRYERYAKQYREQRDGLVRLLRSEDPKEWTLGSLAKAVGCSKELVAHILRQPAV